MIARIRGQLVEKSGDRLVVDVNGVGYLLDVPASVAAELEIEQEVTLLVHTQVRQDAIQLHGFIRRAQREAFELLLGVPGVGPKLALAVLGALSVKDLADAVAQKDLSSLQRAPGVGKRVAQRIALDLSGKLVPEFVPVRPGAQAAAPRELDPLPLALAQLGYKRTEIERALAHLDGAGEAAASLDRRIRLSLKHLSG